MKIKVFLYLGAIYCFELSIGANFRVDPLVLLDQGLVRGQKASDGDYSYFLGIPYARVDLKNPFGPSLPSPVFEDEIFDANKGTVKCPQLNSRDGTDAGDEVLDCLILNIYVPNSASSKNLLPVFVWIHGGGFDSGYAEDGGASNLWKHGVLIVKINYRLGPYGFMCLDSPQVPGNQGLKDQYEALRWIQKNIAAFGGDPENVTIGGSSAGSCSAVLHLYSDKEKLFNKVIAQSGVPQVEGMFTNRYENAAIHLARDLGLNTNATNEALKFLSETPHELVVAAFRHSGFRLLPCKENLFEGVEYYLKNDPYSVSNEAIIRNTPILIGHASKELSSNFGEDNDLDIYHNRIQKNFDLSEEEIVEVENIIKHFYIGDGFVNISLKAKEFDSDFTFNHPIQRTITSLFNDNANPIYTYMFDYVKDPEMTGALHGSDMQYLFPLMLENSPNIDENEQLISDRITELWANFIKFGNPTPSATDLVPVVWEPVSKDRRPYLLIDSGVTLHFRVFKDRMAFWDLFHTMYGDKNLLKLD